MDKAQAIKDAFEKARRQNEECFKEQIESLVFSIERKSQELRELKAKLTAMEYKEPDFDETIL